MSLTSGPVVLDLQALQSPDFRGRGIARYAYELAVALERDHPELVGRYLLNPDLPPPGDLGPLLGSGKVDYADSPDSGSRRCPPPPRAVALRARRCRSTASGPAGRTRRGLRFCATVYDLIPLEHQHPYLDDVRQRARYLGRLEVLRAADALLTISPATSRSLVASLGIDPERIHMVGAGTSRRFAPAASPEDARGAGPDARARPRGRLRPVSRLAATAARTSRRSSGRSRCCPRRCAGRASSSSSATSPSCRRITSANVAATEGIGDRLLLTGHVSDETMLRLYQATELLCFPSLIEGYGLPVAEAMACGAVAIVSDVDPLRDLVTADARFDPSDPAAISCRDRAGADRRGIPRGVASSTARLRERRGTRLRTGPLPPTGDAGPAEPAEHGVGAAGSRSSRRSRRWPLGSPTTASASSRSWPARRISTSTASPTGSTVPPGPSRCRRVSRSTTPAGSRGWRDSPRDTTRSSTCSATASSTPPRWPRCAAGAGSCWPTR